VVGHYADISDAQGLEGFKRVVGAYLRAFPDIRITVHDACLQMATRWYGE